MEVEGSSYSYGFLPPERHHPHGPPPPHPAEEGELWEYFPCPFCYIEVEVPFICNHLQEEHCFDTKHAVCPLCAENIGKDMAAHFRIQHSHLLKRRKPSKPSSWPTASHMNMMSTTATRKYQDPAPDPLLSQFMCSIAQNDFNSNDTNADTAVSEVSDVQRLSRRVDDGASKLELEERLQRIEFLRELLMSTILL